MGGLTRVARRVGSTADDVALTLWRRRFRTALLGLGIASGVALFVFTVSVSSTSANEVSRRLLRLADTDVRIVGTGAARDLVADPSVDEQLARLRGVLAAGRFWQLGNLDLSVGPISIVSKPMLVPVLAASSGAMTYLGATLDGTDITDVDDATGRPIAYVGVGLLATHDLEILPGNDIALGGEQFRIAAILTDVERYSDALFAVTIPSVTATSLWPGRHRNSEIGIHVAAGTAEQVATLAPAIIDPYLAESLTAIYTPDPESLQRDLSSTVDILPTIFAAVLIAGGAIAIGTSWYSSILERRHEIGIRRAVGATGLRIGTMVLLETTLTGLFSSCVGLVFGVAGFLAFSGARSWTPVMPARTLVVAILFGTGVSLMVGIVPAFRATLIQPADALRR